MLLITGPPGSGKTSVARAVAAGAARSAHLACDAFFHFIESGYIDPWRREAHAQNELVMGVAARAANGYSAAGYFTVVEGILLPRWFLDPMREAVGGAGGSVSLAILRPPLEVCVARAASRQPRPMTDKLVVEEIWQEFAELGPLESHVIEDEGMETAAVARLVLERMRAGGLAL